MEAFTAALVLWAKSQALGWLRRHWRKLVAAAVALGGAVAFLVSMAASLVASDGQVAEASSVCATLGYSVDQAAYQPAPVDQAPAIPTGGTLPGLGADDAEKIANARAIVAAATTAGVGKRGMVIAIAVALQESGLANLDRGDRDSLGLFQQRPSQGWGTPQQVRDPTYAALSFFGGSTSPHYSPTTGRASPSGLLDIPGWESMPLTVAAQAVQRSAFPGASAKHEARATVIVDGLLGSATPSTASGDSAAGYGGVTTAASLRADGIDIDSFCSANFELTSMADTHAEDQGAEVPAGTWMAPLQAAITSTFGMRFHPIFHVWRLHAGTDFHAVVGMEIASPAAGVVESVSWDSGGGLNVTIAHGNGIETRHLHLSKVLVKPGDTVAGGQIIALSGDSGVGTGAHYHFEVHIGGHAVDPEPFMLQHGVNLRAWT